MIPYRRCGSGAVEVRQWCGSGSGDGKKSSTTIKKKFLNASRDSGKKRSMERFRTLAARRRKNKAFIFSTTLYTVYQVFGIFNAAEFWHHRGRFLIAATPPKSPCSYIILYSLLTHTSCYYMLLCIASQVIVYRVLF